MSKDQRKRKSGLNPSTALPGQEVIGLLARGQGRDINIQEIDLSDHTFRIRIVFDQNKLNELAESINNDGLINPIVVKKRADGKFQLISGWRRVTAVKDILGKDTIKATIVNIDDETARRLALNENLRRGNLSELELATYCYHLTRILHKPYDEVEKMYGLSPKLVQRLNRIIKDLSDGVKQAFSDGKIAERTALTIAKLKDPGEQDELLAKVLKEKLTAEQINTYLRSVAPSEGAQENPALPPAIGISGRKIIIQSQSTREELVGGLKKLLALAEEGKLDFTLRAAA